MNEPELRALVRDVLARRADVGVSVAATGLPADQIRLARQHASHAMFLLQAGSDGEGPCLIEPAVACNHCGYCKSLGH
jgi:hypothetical protein